MLKQKISLNDIQIYDIGPSFGKTGYNISDLLNMPHFWAGWNQNPHSADLLYNIARETALNNPKTILGKYYLSRFNDEKIPNINRLIDVIDEYIFDNHINRLEIYKYIIDENVLFVHVRSGDYGVISSSYLNIIGRLSKFFKKLVLLAGVNRSTFVDDNQDSEHNLQCRKNLLTSLNLIFEQGSNIYAYFDIPDIHISIMRLCKNLLVHKGGYSVLGSFINNNNIYYTDELPCKDNKKWLDITKYKNIMFVLHQNPDTKNK